MRRSVFFITLLSFLLTGAVHAQDIPHGRFDLVDSFAKTVKYQHDIYRLTNELTGNYPDQLRKARAIFVWITYNIRYDHKFVNSGREIKTPECDPGIYCEQKWAEWRKNICKGRCAGKAICDGYSRLFKKMCDIAGIPCEMVSGYTRTKPYQIGNAGSLDHSWNVLLIDSAYYFVDATWAAGSCEEDEETGKLLPFKKDYDDYYWCTPFEKFTRNHYPKDAKWLLQPGYTKERFSANPYYAPNIIPDIDLLSPATGVIRTAKGDTLHFKFRYQGMIKFLQINSNVFRNPATGEWLKHPRYHIIWKRDTLAMKRQQYVPFKVHDFVYEFDYIVKDSSLYYLELLFDYRMVMRFNVDMRKED